MHERGVLQVFASPARVCILAPSGEAATRLGEALALPNVPRWIPTADQITREDDLILVMDWPRGNLAACAAARARTTVPIIILSAAPSSSATVRLLGAGADLVLPRSVDPGELQARIRALLRRQLTPSDADVFHTLRLSDSSL